jgi:transposase
MSSSKSQRKYYTGKKVSADEFEAVWDKYRVREISQEQAAKELGVSTPTFKKWVNILWENGFTLRGASFIRQDTL